MIIHAQVGNCGGCVTAKVYEKFPDEEIYYTQHSLAEKSLIEDKFGAHEKVNVVEPEELPEADVGIIEGPVCFQDKEETKKILEAMRSKAKKLIGIGVCICGNWKNTGGLISPICSNDGLGRFCRFLRMRHFPAVRFVDIDYAIPICSPTPEGITTLIEAALKGDEDHLRPFERMAEELPTSLDEEVVDEDLCISCGACAATCITRCIEMVYGKPKVERQVNRSECVKCGTCWFQCPRSFIDLDTLTKQVFGKLGDENVGNYQEIYAARSTDPEILKIAQDGGIGTALLSYAFEKGIVEGAAVALRSEESPWKPVDFIARNKEDLIKAAGTKYTYASVISTTRNAIEDEGLEKLAFIGTPCMVQAIRKMEAYPYGARDIHNHIEFSIGLVCMENWVYSSTRSVIEYEAGVPLSKVTKTDIEKGKFWIYTVDGDVIGIPLKDAAKYAGGGCSVCLDYVSELSDISIGSVGVPSGWSSLFVRTDKGKEIVESAIEEGYIEAKPVDEVKPGLDMIIKLSRQKKEKNMKNILKRQEDGMRTPMLMTWG
jgi:coenzyme F420 hydrogenase subunit beta